jgi:hypothetical protein
MVFYFVENPTSVDSPYCFSCCFSLRYFPVDIRQQIHQQFPFDLRERKKTERNGCGRMNDRFLIRYLLKLDWMKKVRSDVKR